MSTGIKTSFRRHPTSGTPILRRETVVHTFASRRVHRRVTLVVMSGVQVTIDEGGIRHEARDERRYVPFAEIEDVELRTRLLREPVVSVMLSAGEELTLLTGSSALEIHRGLAEHLASRRRGPHIAPPEWKRAGRAITEWLGAIEASTLGGYRDSAAACAIALGVAEDADADVEDRAAAVHLLLRIAEGKDLVRAMKVVVGRELPPITQIAARLASGGSSFVADDVAAEAASFLASRDRADLRAALTQTNSATEAQLAAIDEARKELADEARRSTTSHADSGGRTRHGSAGGDRDMSRWIGKSWG